MPDTTDWITNPTNGHKYRLISAGTWLESNAAAESQGAHLVSINDATEQNWLVTQFGDYSLYWIGLTDQQTEGQFVWTTGEPVTYTNWVSGDPNDGGMGGEDYGIINWGGNGLWADWDSAHSISAIIEISDGAGNTPSLARNIGALNSTTQTFTDWVDSTDTNDYYRFTLAGTRNLHLTLTGLSADADVIVYAANGTTVLGSSNSSGSLSDTININNLATGTYYARIFPGAATVNTSYSLGISAQFIDSAGNTTATARNIGALGITTQTFTDWVGSTDTNDYYQFTLGGTRNLHLTLTGLSADADVIVYAANGTTVLGSSNSSGSLSDTININNLATGTYYARIFPGAATVNTSYSLDISAQFIDSAGNTITAARNIGALGTITQTFTDWVGSTDSNDYYGFTLGSTSNLRLSLSGLGANANVLVYAANGTTVLGTGANTGITSEAIAINNLVAGTYYARVYPGAATANTSYSLGISAQFIDYAGNTTTAARNIGALGITTQTFTDWVGSTDTNDYYQFTLGGTRNLRLTLTGLSADADVIVYAANGTTILGSSNSSGSLSDTININNLATGTYYARVYPGAATVNTNYSLALSAQFIDSAGNTTTTARNIGALGTTTQTFTDWVGITDTNDYYRFTLGSTSNLRLSLSGLGANANVVVYSADGVTVRGSGSNVGVANEAVNINNLTAGTYYARVYPGAATVNTNYSLGLSAQFIDYAGNTTTAARNIGVLGTTTQTFTDWVDSTDTNDYYRFTLGSINNLRVNLTGLAANVNVVVYASNGTTVVGTGANTGITNEAIAINNLVAGTYYARVYPGVATANTNYSLGISTAIAARNIGVLGTTTQIFADWVGSSEANDYYQFTLNSLSTLRLNLTGLSDNANVIVYAADGTGIMGSGSNAGNTSEAVTISNLTAGTYYARVYPGAATVNTNYSLALTAQSQTAMVDLAGNSLATASDIGILSTTTPTFTDRVGSTDTNDYYRFTLGSMSNLRVSLSDMSADADIMIYAADGVTVVSGGYTSSNNSEIVNVDNLAAGTYYLRVYPYTGTASGEHPGSTNYNLSLEALPTTGNNSTATARNIGALNATTQTFTDWIGNTNPNDFYRFTTSSTSNLRLSLTGLTANANVVIYAANGTTIVGSGGSTGTNGETVDVDNLLAGTYYVRVLPGVTGAQTNYSLAVAALATSDNTAATANNLGGLTDTVSTISDHVGVTDTSDYYQFALNEVSSLRLTLGGMTDNADVVVYAADGTTVIGTGSNVGTTAEQISTGSLAAGTYYARVYSTGTGNTNYNLGLAASPRSDNVMLTTSNDLGTLTATPQIFNDWVGLTDPIDYYRFTTSDVSNLRLNLTDLTANANVTVYAANGSTILGSSSNTGAASEMININNLAAGTYYVRVVPYGVGTSADTNYSLSIAAPPLTLDNATATARDIGVVGFNSSQTYYDWVGTADPSDYYRFTMMASAPVQLNFTGLDATASYTLYNNDGTTVLSTGTGNTSGILAVTTPYLAAGNYYVRMASTAVTGANYGLSIATVSNDYNDSIGSSTNLGTLGTTTWSVNASVSTSANTIRWFGTWAYLLYDYGISDQDYYSFSLTTPSDLRVAYSSNGSGYVALLDNSGSIVANITSTTTSVANLAAGTYYARVIPYVPSSGHQWVQTADYSLSLATDVVGSGYDTTATARNLGTLNATTQTFTDQIGGLDISDYYRFNLGATDNVRINLTSVSANVDVAVYAANGTTLVGSSSNGGTRGEVLELSNLNANTYYYIQVYGTAANTAYQLSVASNTTTQGGSGNDTLYGGSGNDTLTGGAGADTFRFVTTVNSGIDTITDFQSGTDKIQVVSPNFANIPVGTLATNRLVAAGTPLTTGNAVFLYNGTTGGLSFDRDGNGSTAAVQIATLTGHPTLRASDFQVVAA